MIPVLTDLRWSLFRAAWKPGPRHGSLDDAICGLGCSKPKCSSQSPTTMPPHPNHALWPSLRKCVSTEALLAHWLGITSKWQKRPLVEKITLLHYQAPPLTQAGNRSADKATITVSIPRSAIQGAATKTGTRVTVSISTNRCHAFLLSSETITPR